MTTALRRFFFGTITGVLVTAGCGQVEGTAPGGDAGSFGSTSIAANAGAGAVTDANTGGTTDQAGSTASPGNGGTSSAAGSASGVVGGAGGAPATAGSAGTGGTTESGGAAGVPGGGGSDGGSNVGGSAGTTDAGGAGGEAGTGNTPDLSAGCEELLSDPSINWRESSLQTDQEIVECLATSLGTPVGYGENARGGYDPDGASRLVVITKGGASSPEEQILDAISAEDHKWIVFDKQDFAEPSELAMYRLFCDDAAVQGALGISSAENCIDHDAWCAANSVSAESCLETFFNQRLNDGDLPIRNPEIFSNTTIDGRGSEAYFLFSGFKIGADQDSQPTHTVSNVIVTNLLFQGAGHNEDHGLDPDMLRSTGASSDIWIHQNTFELTGDSAFDVKVGAHDITMSFNLLRDVQRATLHASSDSETVSEQITTTMHHNAFITTDELYDYFGDGGRRVPLIRLGRSHMFNNVFFNYRKDVLSVRVGARLAFEDNMFLVNQSVAGDDDLDYLVENLLDGYEEGGLEITGSYVWMSDATCQLDPAASGDLTASFGTTPDLLADYGDASRSAIDANRLSAGAELADYVFATAGKGGLLPFNAPGTLGREVILAMGHTACQ